MNSVLPPSSNPPAALPPTQPLDRNQVAVKLLDLAPDLKVVPVATTLTGRITEARRDGTVRIETSQGNITIQVPPRVAVNVGQTVEISLPPGKPPREATIATTKPEPPPQPPPATTPVPSTQEPDPAARVPRAPNTPLPVDNELRQIAIHRTAAGSAAPSTPQINQIVQIKTITAAHVRTITSQTPSVPGQSPTLQTQIQPVLTTSLSTIPIQVIPRVPSTIPSPPLMDNAPAALSLSPFILPATPQTPVNGPLSVPHENQIISSPPTTGNIPALLFDFSLLSQKAVLKISDVFQAKETGGLLNISLPSSEDLPDQSRLTLVPILIQESGRPALLFPPEGPVTSPVLPQPQTILARIMAIDTAPLPFFIPSASHDPTAAFLPPVRFDPPFQNGATTLIFLVIDTTEQGHVVLQMGGTQPALTQSPAVSPFPFQSAAHSEQSEFFLLQTAADGLRPGTALLLQPILTTLPKSLGMLPVIAPQMIDDLTELMNVPPLLFFHENPGAMARLPVPNINIPQQMGASVLFFLAALRSGDLQSWLGERTVDAVRRAGKGGLIDKMSASMETLRSALTDRANSEWRTYVLPFQFHHDLKPVTIHIKPDEPGNQQKDQQKGQRFVVDITLNRMGNVQLDMLYRPGVLDTILRTEFPLSRPMADVLAEKYTHAMVHANLTGQLFYQNGPKNWVTIDEARETLKVLV